MKRILINFLFLFILLSSTIHADDKPGRFTFIPMVFYTPETSVAFGFSPLYLFPQKQGEKQSNLVGLLIYTINKQLLGFVNWTHYILEGSVIIKGGIYGKHFPSKFYGVGGNTLKNDEEVFLEDSLKLEAGVLFRLKKKFFLGFQYEYEGITIGDLESGGQLVSGTIPGSYGSRVSGLGLLFNLDSTDNNFYPTQGFLLDWKIICYAKSFGGNRNYNSLIWDNRFFANLGQERVIALQLLGEFSSGDVPFNRMAMLGGEKILRGYYAGRFREKNLLSLTAEYRSPLYKRLGFAFFAGVGSVASDLVGLSESSWKYTLGGGLRFQIRKDSKVSMRLDIGFNHEAFGVYVIGLEAF